MLDASFPRRKSTTPPAYDYLKVHPDLANFSIVLPFLIRHCYISAIPLWDSPGICSTRQIQFAHDIYYPEK